MQSNPNEKEQFSNLFFKNKLFPGLSGWVTLDKPKNEKNELDLIDLNYLKDENNDNIDFHLKKFFEEDQHSKLSAPSPQNPFNINPNMNIRKPNPLNRNKKINTATGMKSTLPSFFENLENSIHEFIENSSLNNYSEFTRHFDFMSNIENFFFLEQKQETNEEFNTYSFSKYFHNNYGKLIERLKTYYDNKKLDIRLLLQIMSSFSINMVSDLIRFIKLCDKSFCFDVLKSKNKSQPTPNSNIQENFPYYNNNACNNTNSNNIVTENSSFSLNHGIIENESLFSAECKKNRKGWSVSETEFLERILKSYYPQQIPNEILDDLSKKTNRSVFSIQAKIQKMKKKLQKQTEDIFLKSEERKLNGDSFFSPHVDLEIVGIPEKEEISTTSHENSNFYNTAAFDNNNIGKKSIHNMKGTNKYDIPLENMIKITLQGFPKKMASKPEIIMKMDELFFTKNNKNDSKWKLSTSQLLASSKSFKKIKGTYVLNDKNLTKETLNLINGNNNKNDLNMKMKLIMILLNIPQNKADINEILQSYIKNFKEKDAFNDPKKIKTSIQKVLKQYSEFDTSQSKTFYMLNYEN